MLSSLLEMLGVVVSVALLALFAFAEVIILLQDRGRTDSAASLTQRTTDVVALSRATRALRTEPADTEPQTQATRAAITLPAHREARPAVTCIPAPGAFRPGRVAS